MIWRQMEGAARKKEYNLDIMSIYLISLIAISLIVSPSLANNG